MSGELRCQLVSWNQVYQLCRRLSLLIREAAFQPDIVVAIGRGGYVPWRVLCDFLQLNALASIKAEHYLSGACRQKRVRIRYPLTADVACRRVLVADDVNDTGDTLHVTVQHLESLQPRAVRTAVLHHKMVSRFPVDFFAQKVGRRRWIISPWAVIEDIGDFIQRMRPPPRPLEEAARRLQAQYGLRVSRGTLEDVFNFMGPPGKTAE